MRKQLRALSLACLLAVAATAASDGASNSLPVSAGNVTPERLARSVADAGNWFTGGRDVEQTYFSPLKLINRSNVGRLGYAWSYDIDFSTAFEATPIVVDGRMYTSGNRGDVYALDAKSGKPLWIFKPVVDAAIQTRICCTEVNRGVAVWRGRVYVGSIDGFLYALDAATGSVVWRVDTIVDRSRAYSITGAPYIAKERVIIGNSGSEFDARGYVTAYDAASGEQAWRFFTVPGNPRAGFEHEELALAAKTWSPDSRWEVGLGGTAWDGMVYDPALDLLYVGTGNGAPWNRAIRSPGGGDNLFLASILAIDPDSGRLVWHYQTTPAETWDYTSTQKMILADLRIGGRMRQVIMQAPKNGFFYVLDRRTGELLSAEPYTTVTWASHVDRRSGRPVETGQGDYTKQPKLVFPGPFGGHQWQPMSFSRQTGLVYIPVQRIAMIYSSPTSEFSYEPGRLNMATALTGFTAGGWLSSVTAPGLPPIDTLLAGQPDPKPKLSLLAWDPRRARPVWEIDTTGELDPAAEFLRRGAGVMSTAGGLVFQGGPDGRLRAIDASTGRLLHSIEVNTSMLAAPMTYLIDGEQYVAVMAGVGDYEGYVDKRYGKRGRIVAFKLDGGRVPQREPVVTPATLGGQPAKARFGTAAQIAKGESLYSGYCAVCHNGGRAPDLKRMSALVHAEFNAIVLQGARVDRGMGAFGALLSTDDAEAIHAYLTDSAWHEHENARTAVSPSPQTRH